MFAYTKSSMKQKKTTFHFLIILIIQFVCTKTALRIVKVLVHEF